MPRNTLDCESYPLNLTFFKTLILLGLTLFPPVFASAQTEEEMKMLRMYFKEDELVIAPSRTPKLLSQVAENISIVTADEIRTMNAHTVVEVLSRIPGIYVEFFGEDFGSDANLSIQGSEPEHILVLLDNVPWNSLSGGNATTQTIPVEIIKRIEVIKGPASSSWGSSLGGVINIITKDTIDSTVPSGSLRASIGEKSTQDYRAEVTGSAGKVGYYLYSGLQESGGLSDERDYNNGSIYVKINIPVSSDVDMRFSAGYSEPHIDYGDYISNDITGRDNITRVFFATASITADITDNLTLDGSFYTRTQKFVQETDELSTGDQYFDTIYEDESVGGSGKIIWHDKTHNAVIGIDISDNSLDQKLDSGPALQALGSPASSEADPGIEKWAVFVNDTITIGNLSVTPGMRYDNNNVDGDFTSPSIGATYKFGRKLLFRASVAKGFTTPPLSLSSGGGLFLDPNPDLKPEKVWSYQAGAESWIADYLHAKAVFFHHDMKDALVKELYAAGPPNYNDLYFNKGKIKRDGVELEIRTSPLHNVSAKAGFAYVHKRLYFEEATSEDIYAYNLAVIYDDPKILTAQLDGRYVWWDSAYDDNEYNTFIWDLNLNKNIFSTQNITSDIFFTAHNLFNGSHYTISDRKNPSRWVEAGLRSSF